MLPFDIIAVAAATIVMTAFGIVWYSPMLFGKIWAREAGIGGDAPTPKVLLAKFATHMIFLFVTLAMLSWLLAMIDTKVVEPVLSAAMVAGAFALLGAGVVIWEKRSLAYFWVNTLYASLAIFGGVSVVLYWPW